MLINNLFEKTSYASLFTLATLIGTSNLVFGMDEDDERRSVVTPATRESDGKKSDEGKELPSTSAPHYTKDSDFPSLNFYAMGYLNFPVMDYYWQRGMILYPLNPLIPLNNLEESAATTVCNFVKSHHNILFSHNKNIVSDVRYVIEAICELKDNETITNITNLILKHHSHLFSQNMSGADRAVIIRILKDLQDRGMSDTVCDALNTYHNVLLPNFKTADGTKALLMALGNLQDPTWIEVVCRALKANKEILISENMFGSDIAIIIKAFGELKDETLIGEACDVVRTHHKTLFSKDMHGLDRALIIRAICNLNNKAKAEVVCQALGDHGIIPEGVGNIHIITVLGAFENVDLINTLCSLFKSNNNLIPQKMNTLDKLIILRALGSLNEVTLINDVVNVVDKFEDSLFHDLEEGSSAYSKADIIKALGALKNNDLRTAVCTGIKYDHKTLFANDMNGLIRANIITALGTLKDGNTIKTVCEEISHQSKKLFSEGMSGFNRAFVITSIINDANKRSQ